MIVRTKGNPNLHCYCGRFGYAMEIDALGGPDFIEIWNVWCKKHIPDWAKVALQEKGELIK
jgi:hypothetical protein